MLCGMLLDNKIINMNNVAKPSATAKKDSSSILADELHKPVI